MLAWRLSSSERSWPSASPIRIDSDSECNLLEVLDPELVEQLLIVLVEELALLGRLEERPVLEVVPDVDARAVAEDESVPLGHLLDIVPRVEDVVERVAPELRAHRCINAPWYWSTDQITWTSPLQRSAAVVDERTKVRLWALAAPQDGRVMHLADDSQTTWAALSVRPFAVRRSRGQCPSRRPRGVALTRWSLPRLADHLAAAGVVEISPAHLARVLADAGLSFSPSGPGGQPRPDHEPKAARVLGSGRGAGRRQACDRLRSGGADQPAPDGRRARCRANLSGYSANLKTREAARRIVAIAVSAPAAYASERPIVHVSHNHEWELVTGVDEAIDALGKVVTE